MSKKDNLKKMKELLEDQEKEVQDMMLLSAFTQLNTRDAMVNLDKFKSELIREINENLEKLTALELFLLKNITVTMKVKEEKLSSSLEIIEFVKKNSKNL